MNATEINTIIKAIEVRFKRKAILGWISSVTFIVSIAILITIDWRICLGVYLLVVSQDANKEYVGVKAEIKELADKVLGREK